MKHVQKIDDGGRFIERQAGNSSAHDGRPGFMLPQKPPAKRLADALVMAAACVIVFAPVILSCLQLVEMALPGTLLRLFGDWR